MVPVKEKIMQEIYETPIVEVVKFSSEDIITTSGSSGSGSVSTKHEHEGSWNEDW